MIRTAGVDPAETPARTAEVEVRFGGVELRSPQHRAKRSNVRLWAVWAREGNAPAGVESVEWMLLTTLPVEQVIKLDYPPLRWVASTYQDDTLMPVVSLASTVDPFMAS